MKETRLLFEPGDILGLRIECWSCRSVAMYSAAKVDLVPRNCPHCQASWAESSEDAEQLTYLFRAIRYFNRNTIGPTPAFRPVFEMHGE